jgi:hypothetical protein
MMTRLRVWVIRLLATLAVLAAPTTSFGATAVGDGTAASCTNAAVNAALAAAPSGSTVNFNCGPDPVTILVTEKILDKDLTIDGGGRVTLSGGGNNRVIMVNAGVTVRLLNLTIANGLYVTPEPTDGIVPNGYGGGIYNAGILTIRNSTVSGNSIRAYGSCGLGIYNLIREDDYHRRLPHALLSSSQANRAFMGLPPWDVPETSNPEARRKAAISKGGSCCERLPYAPMIRRPPGITTRDRRRRIYASK